MKTEYEWIAFHADSLFGALGEWESDHSASAACYALESAGMLGRYGQSAFALFVQEVDTDLVIAALRHFQVSNAPFDLCSEPCTGVPTVPVTNTYDETFDLALRVDGLFTAWLVAKHILTKRERINEPNIRCSLALARCVLDDLFALLTDTPDPETGEVRNGGNHYEISMQAIMTQPECLFYDNEAEGLWRALYAERRRRKASGLS